MSKLQRKASSQAYDLTAPASAGPMEDQSYELASPRAFEDQSYELPSSTPMLDALDDELTDSASEGSVYNNSEESVYNTDAPPKALPLEDDELLYNTDENSVYNTATAPAAPAAPAPQPNAYDQTPASVQPSAYQHTPASVGAIPNAPAPPAGPMTTTPRGPKEKRPDLTTPVQGGSALSTKRALNTTSLHDNYKGEEHGLQKEFLPTQVGGGTADHTYYGTKEEYELGMKDGRLLGTDQRVLDTQGVKKLWQKDQDGRINYAMGSDGRLMGADALKDTRKRVAAEGGRSNHSSMVAGGDVAGAGSMRVVDGKVESLDNGSGHYRPDIGLLHQTAGVLQENGVMDEQRSSVTIMKGRADQHAKGGLGEEKRGNDLTISAMELNAYSDDFRRTEAFNDTDPTYRKDAADKIQDEIATRHGIADDTRAELLTLGGGGSDTNLVPSQMKKKANAKTPDWMKEQIALNQDEDEDEEAPAPKAASPYNPAASSESTAPAPLSDSVSWPAPEEEPAAPAKPAIDVYKV